MMQIKKNGTPNLHNDKSGPYQKCLTFVKFLYHMFISHHLKLG
jgi:hypothetical protein